MSNYTEQSYQERVLKVTVYIQNNLDRALTLEELAGVAHFSPYHFHRIFTAHVGESLKMYLRRLRLERAAKDLIYSDLALVRISERAGYDTQQSFQRAFKETFHTTPKVFRKTSQKQIATQQIEKPVKILPVHIKTVAPITVAFSRHVGRYDNVLQTWFRLANAVGLSHILSSDTKKISIPYDSDALTAENKMRYDACITLETLPDFKPRGNVGMQTIVGGKYAIVTHHGAIEEIDSTYQFLFKHWLVKSGYEPADAPNFLLHRTIPYQTASDKLETDIYLPLK